MKYTNSQIAYCIEEVVGNCRTAADVSRETGVSEQQLGKWLSVHWFGNKYKENFETRESSINELSEYER